MAQNEFPVGGRFFSAIPHRHLLGGHHPDFQIGHELLPKQGNIYVGKVPAVLPARASE